MRNGFNTAGFSEVVHEIKNDPAEAKFVYSAKGRRSKITGLTVQVLPALLGTVKSPRQFSFSLKERWIPTPLGEDPIFTPMDLFFAGVGSCMMTTLVGGASARHLALESAVLDLASSTNSDEENLTTSVSANFTLATISEDARCEELVGRVTQQSPNYVTLSSAAHVEIRSDALSSSEARGAEPSVISHAPVSFGDIAVDWISGTQCLVSSGENSSDSSLRVDAPKQLTGVDWGPNPQEYLLAGLAAEISGLLFKHSFGTPFEGRSWEAVATGVEDVRGFLNTDPEVEVGLQDIEVLVTPPTGAPEAVGSIVSRAISDSEILTLLTHPTEISLSWRRATHIESTTKLALRPGVGE